jgi:hypothetical protein
MSDFFSLICATIPAFSRYCLGPALGIVGKSFCGISLFLPSV